MKAVEVSKSRRKFLIKAAYTAPLIATISVLPSVASAGSPFVRNEDPAKGGNEQPGAAKPRKRNHNNQWSPW